MTGKADNQYLDTRAQMQSTMPFTQAIVKGLAPGGGLLVPQIIPQMTLDEILALAKMPYAKRAADIFKRFCTDMPDSMIDELTSKAYGSNFDDERIAPVVKVDDGMYVMELWHGPTSAFKDMALQCLPLFFSRAIEMLRQSGEDAPDYLILVATSGDTGKAALEGFKDSEHISIIVFYPHGGVSDIQFKQMATQLGSNLAVFGCRGDFDDCQSSVKQTFGDADFAAKLAAENNTKLSSANSINWGRLMPQIVYYVSAYSQMVADGALAAGDELDICVPTGNFGNILGAYYAKRMGVPIGKLVCASNENRVLADFIESGVYDISERQLILTPSPSMDILVSSNMERQLFELSGRDGARIRSWMEDLSTNGRFEVDPEVHEALQSLYACGSASNDESLATIRRVLDTCNYLMDPHTAVAWTVAEQNRSDRPMLVVSTAHWAKFGSDVYRAMHKLPAGSELPSDVASLTGAQLNDLVSSEAGGVFVPDGLARLDEMELRFTEVCDAGKQSVEQQVISFLSRSEMSK